MINTNLYLFIQLLDRKPFYGMKQENDLTKNFCKIFINRDTGVNGNVVGDEFAYDIVPAKDETKWNKTETSESIISTQLELQEGK